MRFNLKMRSPCLFSFGPDGLKKKSLKFIRYSLCVILFDVSIGITWICTAVVTEVS
jgi:hypothetical protein